MRDGLCRSRPRRVTANGRAWQTKFRFRCRDSRVPFWRRFLFLMEWSRPVTPRCRLNSVPRRRRQPPIRQRSPRQRRLIRRNVRVLTNPRRIVLIFFILKRRRSRERITHIIRRSQSVGPIQTLLIRIPLVVIIVTIRVIPGGRTFMFRPNGRFKR